MLDFAAIAANYLVEHWLDMPEYHAARNASADRSFDDSKKMAVSDVIWREFLISRRIPKRQVICNRNEVHQMVPHLRHGNPEGTHREATEKDRKFFRAILTRKIEQAQLAIEKLDALELHRPAKKGEEDLMSAYIHDWGMYLLVDRTVAEIRELNKWSWACWPLGILEALLDFGADLESPETLRCHFGARAHNCTLDDGTECVDLAIFGGGLILHHEGDDTFWAERWTPAPAK